MMKVTTCFLLLGVLVCLLHAVSAQQNWWERDPDGKPVVSTSRTTRPTTTRPTTAPSQGSTASTAATLAPVSPTCACPKTPEYNPVCGNNRITYDNPGQLECAKNTCGERVELLFHGRCLKLS